MKKLTIQELKSQLSSKRLKGDYILISKMLGIDGGAARKQFERAKPEAVIALYFIIERREQLIEQAEFLIEVYKQTKLIK